MKTIGACLLSLCLIFCVLGDDPFKAKPLPYKEDALEPWMSKETVGVHYHKHHVGYVNKLNKAAKKIPELKTMTLEQIIKSKDLPERIVQLACQIWNHDFFWKSLRKDDGPAMHGLAFGRIGKDFESFDRFQLEFSDRAISHFGSGWVWLVFDFQTGKMRITEGHDAQNPMQDGLTPLLCIDVWEHAYYLDYKNDRKTFVDTWWNNINWNRVYSRIKTIRDEWRAIYEKEL